MLTPSETQQKPNLINQEVGQAITVLGESILPEFSHSISHEISDKSLKISYTLHHIEEDNPVVIDGICQVFCNFLEFYVIANFIFPYYSNSPIDEPSLTEHPLTFKIRTNNTTESNSIAPTKILSQISFDTITTTSSLKSVITNIIDSELMKHAITGSKQPLTLHFDAIFYMKFDIEKLNQHLTTNLPVIRGISQLHPIIALYHNSPLTAILPESQTKDLKLTVIHVKNPQNRTSNASISACITTSDTKSSTLPTTFIRHLCNTQYNYLDLFTLYEVNLKTLNTLPNLQESPLKYHKQSITNYTTTYKLTCSDFTQDTFCQQLLSYINLFNILYDTQQLKLSIELLLKENITTRSDVILEPRFDFPDLSPDTNTQKLLFTVCNIPYRNSLLRMFSRKHTDSVIQNKLTQYDIYLHVTPSETILKQIPMPIATQDTESKERFTNTLPHFMDQTSSTPQPQASTSTATPMLEASTSTTAQHPQNEKTSSPTKIEPQKRVTHTSPHLMTQTSSTPPPQASTSAAVPMIEASTSTTAQHLQNEKTSYPSSTQKRYIRTVQQDISTLRKIIKSPQVQVNKPTYKKHPKRNIMPISICISILTISSIIGYYILSNQFLTCYQDIEKINATVILGIFCCGTIALIGVILYHRIQVSNNLAESITSNPTNTLEKNTLRNTRNK